MIYETDLGHMERQGKGKVKEGRTSRRVKKEGREGVESSNGAGQLYRTDSGDIASQGDSVRESCGKGKEGEGKGQCRGRGRKKQGVQSGSNISIPDRYLPAANHRFYTKPHSFLGYF